ncbi:hypothetical protein FRC00_007412 [Tulasnella sp. 408]|nr:hypothetical protein FRC00_007412 [Tulasnella sp. 408]
MTQPDSTFQSLLGTVTSSLKRIEITYNERNSEFGISSERIVEVPNEWIHHIDECPGLAIRVKVPPSLPTWDMVAKFVGGLPVPASDNLLVLQDHSEASPFPVQTLNEWDFIAEVEISPAYDPRPLFEHLSQPQTVYPAGEQKWPLPNLSQVYSKRNEADSQEMKEALVNFLRRSNAPQTPNAGASENLPLVLPRPKQLQKLKVHSSILESLKEDSTLAGIEIISTS